MTRHDLRTAVEGALDPGMHSEVDGDSVITFDLARAEKEGCRTKSKRRARIVVTDAKGDFPLGVLVESEDGSRETFESYMANGSYGIEQHTNMDLVNLPEAHEVTVQIWRNHQNLYGATVTLNGLPLVECGSSRFAEPNSAEPWDTWGKPVTVRIEKDD